MLHHGKHTCTNLLTPPPPPRPPQVSAEQLGGAVGGCAVGPLTEMRSRMVSRQRCEQCARQLGLEKHIVMGKGLWSELRSSARLELLWAQAVQARRTAATGGHARAPPVPACRAGPLPQHAG